MKKLLLILSLLSATAFANSNSLNLQLPNGQNNYSSDKFKSPFDDNTAIGNSTKDVGVYARITIPLDGPKERINCNTLYQLELKKKRLEVLKLEQELKKLRELQLKNKLNNNVKIEKTK